MDAAPHTHTVEIRTRKEYTLGSNADTYYVQYGDTQVDIGMLGRAGPHKRRFKRCLKQAVAVAIRLHDEGSIKAGKIESKKKDALLEINEALAGSNVDRKDEARRKVRLISVYDSQVRKKAEDELQVRKKAEDELAAFDAEPSWGSDLLKESK